MGHVFTAHHSVYYRRTGLYTSRYLTTQTKSSYNYIHIKCVFTGYTKFINVDGSRGSTQAAFYTNGILHG